MGALAEGDLPWAGDDHFCVESHGWGWYTVAPRAGVAKW
jgi:hypothetical protein